MDLDNGVHGIKSIYNICALTLSSIIKQLPSWSFSTTSQINQVSLPLSKSIS